MPNDSPEYRKKKRALKKILTIYGRNPVQEALEQDELSIFRLHLAESNKPCSQLDRMIHLAEQKGAEVLYHTRHGLARISKNSKQDQGVALDIQCEAFRPVEEFLQQPPQEFELIAIDGVTNPQNLGMIIRSVCASPLTALLLPEKGCAKLDALVIKASAGTLFKAPLLRCEDLPTALRQFREAGADILTMDSGATKSLHTFQPASRTIYVLGNESTGVSPAVRSVCNDALRIPMANGVESLNVSITAALLAFRPLFRTDPKSTLS